MHVLKIPIIPHSWFGIQSNTSGNEKSKKVNVEGLTDSLITHEIVIDVKE